MDTYLGDYGTEFIGTIKNPRGEVVSVGAASVIEYEFRRPAGTAFLRTGSLYTDGSDGKDIYTTVNGEIDSVGYWTWQVRIVLPSGQWYTDVHGFPVRAAL
jgi:hypothetical protein